MSENDGNLVEVIFDDISYRIGKQEVNETLRVVLSRENKRGVTINIVFTDDKYMRGLNKNYLGEDRTTDVMSFNIDEEMLGEIYVSLPQARRQAQERGIPIKVEIKRLLIHGLLHLLGYDHASEEEKRLMFAKQEHYLSEV
ncbi:MAG: rRNA maturation RNase YbeY [candidate division Zixibacteria bacterium]|nr:rRNA maturation RNase YbeY [candidate division Zixibacteria bacterium]